MFRTSLKRKSLVAAALVTASMLGACISVPAPGGGGNGGGGGPIAVTPPQSSVPCQQRVGNNGGVGFWDVGLAQCWACPAGSNRTIFDVRGSDACQFGFPFGEMVAAERLD